jgi:ABC-2 type transport system ATP-binding protein
MDNPAVKVKNLQKKFGNFQAVGNLNLTIDAGEFFGLLGPNGAGKTTSINMMSSLVRPTSGNVSVFGLDVVKQSAKVRSKIGLVFQDSALDRQLSVWENLRFAGLLHNLSFNIVKERADYLLNLFNLYTKKNSSVATLSGGQRRVLDIARGVMHEPQLLFLDEPTIGLDLPTRRSIWRFIHQLRNDSGMTVLLTTHYLEEAETCNRVAFLKSGNLVLSGNPKELVNELASEIIEIETLETEKVLEFTKNFFGPALSEFETLFLKSSRIAK